MVGGGEVFINGVLGANSVGGKISGGGEGITFVFEDQATDKLRVELDNHRAGVRVLLGGDGEGMAKGEVHGGGVAGGKVSTTLGGIKNGGDNLLEDDTGDCSWGGGGCDERAMDSKRVGAEGLLKAVHLFGEVVDGGVLLPQLLA